MSLSSLPPNPPSNIAGSAPTTNVKLPSKSVQQNVTKVFDSESAPLPSSISSRSNSHIALRTGMFGAAAGLALTGLAVPSLMILTIPAALGLASGAVMMGRYEKNTLVSDRSIKAFFSAVGKAIINGCERVTDTLFSSKSSTIATKMTDVDVITSQGLLKSDDGTCVISHESTTPPSSYYDSKGPKYKDGINMDRGAFGQRKDGSNYASLFDGTSSGGTRSAYAAQAFSQQIMADLASGHVQFTGDKAHDIEIAQKLFTNCGKAPNLQGKTGQQYEMEDGDATAVFVDCVPSKKDGRFTLHAAALGDSAVIHFDRKTMKAEQLNTIARVDASDPGGCISATQEDARQLSQAENISVTSRDVAGDDFILLASDGLLDNIADGEVGNVLSFIAASDFFDQSLTDIMTKALPWEQPPSPHLPTAEELKAFAGTQHLEKPVNTQEQLAKRIDNYIKMVTESKRQFQEERFALMAKLHHEPPSDPGELAALQAQVKQAENELASAHSAEKAGHVQHPGKTDDCMLVVLTPKSAQR